MFKIGFIFLFTFLSINLYSQQAVISTGANLTGINGEISFSVGQIVSKTIKGGTGSINEGVQQPFEITIETGLQHEIINLKTSVYPNPTKDILLLEIEDKKLTKSLSFKLYNIEGQLLELSNILSIETLIYMNNYNHGIYFLKVLLDNSEFKTFKIIKN